MRNARNSSQLRLSCDSRDVRPSTPQARATQVKVHSGGAGSSDSATAPRLPTVWDCWSETRWTPPDLSGPSAPYLLPTVQQFCLFFIFHLFMRKGLGLGWWSGWSSSCLLAPPGAISLFHMRERTPVCDATTPAFFGVIDVCQDEPSKKSKGNGTYLDPPRGVQWATPHYTYRLPLDTPWRVQVVIYAKVRECP